MAFQRGAFQFGAFQMVSDVGPGGQRRPRTPEQERNIRAARVALKAAERAEEDAITKRKEHLLSLVKRKGVPKKTVTLAKAEIAEIKAIEKIAPAARVRPADSKVEIAKRELEAAQAAHEHVKLTVEIRTTRGMDDLAIAILLSA